MSYINFRESGNDTSIREFPNKFGNVGKPTFISGKWLIRLKNHETEPITYCAFHTRLPLWNI